MPPSETEATIQRLIDKGLIVRQDFFNITKLGEKALGYESKEEDCCHERIECGVRPEPRNHKEEN